MKRLPSPLIDETVKLFLACEIPCSRIAKETGLNIYWLENLQRYYIKGLDFHCSKIETLNKYLKENK